MMENINLFISNFAEMLHKDFTFYEGMKDTPKFRFQLSQNERYFERLQKRMEEMIKSINIVIDQGQHFMSSLYNLTVSLNRLWLDLEIDEAKEKIAFETYNILSDSLSQIVYLQKSLVEHAYPLLRAGFESFLKREMEKLADVKIHFDSLSTSLSDALSKKAAINKNKTQELQDAENSLTAIGTCFSHTGLDYVAQINIAHALKSPVILETLWAFIKEHGNFFTRGANFFVEQQEYMIGDALASMRASYKQIERKMQDRHTFVPKEIFQFPTGIPIDPECIMEGYLFKRSTNAFKTWNRRWFMIKEDKLTSDGEPEIPTIMEENLKLCLVRPAPSSIERACCFELVTPIKNHLLQADTETLCTAWIRALQRTIQHLHEDENGTYKNSRKSFVDNININESDIATTSSSIDGADDSNTQNRNILNETNNSNSSTSNLKNAEIAKQNMKSFLKDLLNVPGNDKCADCACENPKWTSLNLGIIICIECSGVHRSFGVQFSKVRSLTMDTLEIEQKNILLQLGNNFVNSIFLGNLPKTESHDAFYGINKHSSRETREKWITDKYINKIFVKSLASNKPHTRSYSSLLPISSANSVANTNSVKMRSSGVMLDELNIREDQDNQKLFVNKLECRISQSSFGSDSNLMQSASKAALACRESLISLRENNFMEDIKCGNIGKIFEWIVQKNIGLNDGITFEGSLFSTLLHAATENNQPTLVEFLLLNGAKINNVDEMKNTPLHLASDKGHTIIVYQLLKRNAEKSLKNIELKTPLDIAVERCHADIVTLLRLHEMKEEFNDDQNSTMDETVESFIGDLAAKQYLQEARTSESKEIQN